MSLKNSYFSNLFFNSFFALVATSKSSSLDNSFNFSIDNKSDTEYEKRAAFTLLLLCFTTLRQECPLIY